MKGAIANVLRLRNLTDNFTPIPPRHLITFFSTMIYLADGLKESLWVNIKEKSWSIPGHPQRYLEEHTEIFNAIKNKDSKDARKRMRHHQSMYGYTRLGLIHFMAYPETINGEGPILETLQKIAEDDFFTAVEISWIKDEERRERAKKLLEASHSTLAYGTQPRLLVNKLDLNSFDKKGKKKGSCRGKGRSRRGLLDGSKGPYLSKR